MKDFFEHHGFDTFDEDVEIERRDPMCRRCGSTDVRWRQQNGKWMLFSLQPGKVHACPISTDGFEPVAE